MDPSKTIYLNDNFNLTLPYPNLDQDACASELREILNKIRTFYFGNDKIGNKTIRQFVRMLSDLNYGHPVQRTAALLAAKSTAPIRYQV